MLTSSHWLGRWRYRSSWIHPEAQQASVQLQGHLVISPRSMHTQCKLQLQEMFIAMGWYCSKSSQLGYQLTRTLVKG
uniref:Uncharacterized protein n=1 Tax=Salix viminalis TaxID=40686 RepID=A0A6N2K665_SALVM